VYNATTIGYNNQKKVVRKSTRGKRTRVIRSGKMKGGITDSYNAVKEYNGK
jgi:hypothetical protein